MKSHSHISIHIGGSYINVIPVMHNSQCCHLKKHAHIHIEDKPYKCDTCGEQFSTIGFVNSHDRIHTGEIYIYLIPVVHNSHKVII